MTVNRALRELTEEGVLKRIAGVGTFVAEMKPQSNLLMIAHIRDEIRARGHEYRCRVLSQSSGPRRSTSRPRSACRSTRRCFMWCACTRKTAARSSSRIAT